MKIDLKTTSEDQNFEGMCPACKEHTTAGDSCCGRGAYVEGGLISDESAIETLENPQVGIALLKDVPHAKAEKLHHELFHAGISTTLSGIGDKWTLRIFLGVGELPTREDK